MNFDIIVVWKVKAVEDAERISYPFNELVKNKEEINQVVKNDNTTIHSILYSSHPKVPDLVKIFLHSAKKYLKKEWTPELSKGSYEVLDDVLEEIIIGIEPLKGAPIECKNERYSLQLCVCSYEHDIAHILLTLLDSLGAQEIEADVYNDEVVEYGERFKLIDGAVEYSVFDIEYE